MGKGKGVRLGRGLSSLLRVDGHETVIDRQAKADLGAPLELSIDWIQPNGNQPRKHFEETAVRELADSIEKNGLLQPIVVRVSPIFLGKYEIVAGERRWRACKLANLKKVPVIVKDASDEKVMELALIENIQREDLTPLEEAEAYNQLLSSRDITQEGLSALVSKSRSHIANTLRLLKLDDDTRGYLARGEISAGHARTLLSAKEEDRAMLAKEIVDNNYNVRDTEELIRTYTLTQEPGSESSPVVRHRTVDEGSKNNSDKSDEDIKELLGSLQEMLGLKINLSVRGGSKKLTIHFKSYEDLDGLIDKLTS